MKKSIRILSILMAFVMLIGSFSVMGSAYHAYKGTAIAGDYNDVDSPEFSLDQYASMALDELDRMLAKEQMVLDLLGLLTLDLSSVDATIASVLSFLNTGAALIPLLGDAKTLPDICNPLRTISRGAKTDNKKDLDVIYGLLDFVANLRDIAYNYVAGTVSVGILDGFIADYKFDVRELAIGMVYGMLEEGEAIDFDYIDQGGDAIPSQYKDPNNGAINILQTLLNEAILGEWKLLDDEFNNPQSNVDYFNYGFQDKYNETYFNTDEYDYYGYVHPKSWVTVGLGGCARVANGSTNIPAADFSAVDVRTGKSGYEFIENLLQIAFNYLLVPVLNRDTIEWVLGQCGYTFDETLNNKTLWRPLTNEDGTPKVDENGEPVYGSVANPTYDPEYRGDAPQEFPVLANLFKHEEMHAGNIKVQKVEIPAGETIIDNLNTILGDFVANIATNHVEVNGVEAYWTWDYEGGNEVLFDNIVDFGKYVVIVTGDFFFSERAVLPSVDEIKAMNGQEIVSLIVREILNNSVDYIYVEDTYNTLVDVGYRATEQLAWQDIPQQTYVKPVASDYTNVEDYYAAVVNKMIDMLFDIAVYNLNQTFDMDPAANGSNPISDTGLLQYQGNNGSYETNLVKMAEWGFSNYGALLNTKYVDFRCDNPGTHTADDVWMDIDTLLNAIIPIKGGEGNNPWISETIAGDGSQIVSKKFIFDHLLKPVYTLDATNLLAIFEKNENGAFATMNGVQIIVDILDNVFDLIFPDVFKPQATVDAVLQNELLAAMVYDLIGSLGYSSFTSKGGAPMEGRGGYIAATALPIACMILGLADDQEFEEMEIYLPENIAAGSTAVTFDVINNSSGINTGYTDKNGNFTQDQLYTYKIVSKNVYSYNSAGVNTNAIADNLTRGATIAGGDRINVTLTGTFAANTLIEYVVNYDIYGESGDVIASNLSKTVYAYVGTTDKSDDEIEIEEAIGDTGRAVLYTPAIFLAGGDDFDDIEPHIIRVQDTDSGATGALNATAVTGMADYVQLSTDAGDISHAMTGEGGVYFVYPFEVKTHTVTDEESGETYEEKWGRKEPIYERDENDEIIYDENGDPNIIDYTDGVENGSYTLTTALNIAGTTKNVNTALHIYDDFGLESAFTRAVSANRQISNYKAPNNSGAEQDAYAAYVAVLKDVARFVLKPKAASTFAADIKASNSEYENRYEELAVALEDAIEELEQYETNTGVGGLKEQIIKYSGINYEIVAGPDADYRKELEYDDPNYVYFGMRDYVPHTYNRYKDALGRANGLIESQEIVAMAPFTDTDIYGENYQPSEDEIAEYGKSVEAYRQAKANQAVVGSIESIYAAHMLKLTGDRLIRLEADTSKLQLVYNQFAGRVSDTEAANYTSDSLETYRRAEAFALKTLNTPIENEIGDPKLAPSQVNRATTELVYAWKHLTKGADYTALTTAINDAADAISVGTPGTQTVYTPETFEAFYNAYQAAVNVDPDLGDTTDNNNLIAQLAAALNDARLALQFAVSGDPTFEVTQDPVFFDAYWENTVVPFLDYDTAGGWGLALEDGTPIDAVLFAGIGISSPEEVEAAFINVENCTISVTEDAETGAFGTGSVVQILDNDGNPLETYYIIVKGEINNDTSIETMDSDEISLFASGDSSYDYWWSSPRIIAADINSDFFVDAMDTDPIFLLVNEGILFDMITGESMY